MTKFDIRIRRQRFSKGRIERHKDFQNLMGNYDKSSRKNTRGVMVLVIALIILIAILLAFFNTPKEEKQNSETDQISYHQHISEWNGSVYKV